MKTLFLISIVIGSLYGCKEQVTTPSSIQKQEQNESNVQSITFDTIIIDHELNNKKTKERNEHFKTLAFPSIIDSLKSFCKLQGMNKINSDSLPFQDPMEIGQYYENNIPKSVYQIIFPEEEIKTDRIIKTNPKLDHENKKVIINKGAKITEERNYKTLLSLIEKEKYLQLVMTKQGKFIPEIELITVSKDKLSKIDQLNLMGGIYDSSDINYWHSVISDDYQYIEITKVENLNFDETQLDTTYNNYYINQNGEILKS